MAAPLVASRLSIEEGDPPSHLAPIGSSRRTVISQAIPGPSKPYRLVWVRTAPEDSGIWVPACAGVRERERVHNPLGERKVKGSKAGSFGPPDCGEVIVELVFDEVVAGRGLFDCKTQLHVACKLLASHTAPTRQTPKFPIFCPSLEAAPRSIGRRDLRQVAWTWCDAKRP